mmetsp:Transcript_105610/g.340582  ORF Transcript_105610/g.340582 Transcript_105610/m.340582 type:complete len:97 (+) Transcript_105610:647-937(+)
MGALQPPLQNSPGWPFHVGLLQPGRRQTASSEAEEEVSADAEDEPAEVERAEFSATSPQAFPPRCRAPQPGCAQMSCLCKASWGCRALDSMGQKEV